VSAVAALLGSTPTAAQSITATVDRTAITVGDHVAFTVEVEGRDAGGAVVDPPDARGLELVSVTPVYRAMSSINGRASLTLRWSYRALAAGRGRIGSARAIVAGRARMTDPIEIVVSPRATSAGPAPPGAGAGEGELYVRAVARPERPFVGQQVVVDYVLYFRGHLEPRSAQFVGAWQAEGLWREELDVPPSSRSPRPAGNGYWSVLVRRVALYPTRSGEVRLGELTFEIELLRREEDPFGFFGAYSSRFERASPTAPAVELQARALPAGAPVGFGGAVGRFSLRAGFDREDAEVGDPVQLTAVVEGNGNLATLAPPVIDAPASFERYEPSEDRTLDRSGAPATGRKTFGWSMVPRSGGRFEVGLRFAYFDPVREEYRALAVPNLGIDVAGAIDPVAAATDGPAPTMAATTWRRDGAGRPGFGWLAGGAVLPIAAFAALSARTRLRRPRRRRPPPPLASARAAIDDSAAFYRSVESSLREALAAGRVSDGDRPTAEALLQKAGSVLYSPGAPPTADERGHDLDLAERLVTAGPPRVRRRWRGNAGVIACIVALAPAAAHSKPGRDDAGRLLALGDSLLEAGDLYGAEAAYATVSSWGWTSAALAHNRGLTALRAGREGEAIAYLLESRRLSHGNPAIQQSLAAARVAAE
jgi:hypothetical protein